ncbi:hypothetical protein POTOM_033369 [Populus tomentosa]|uniref:AB hydrolase-1 domain-containing protein n=1 Tax=Populus tomentosa TaxID=118781 RepID=A0A8X8CRC9_POPTO|nr:hypothetical protein POTOM_033369 [Populus tomentosa]
MVNSIAIYTSFLRAILGLAGVRPQSVEIEPGTVVHIWAPSETAKKTNNLKQAENKPSKPAVVFLHGFGFNGILSWQFQVLALAKEYSVYVPDFLFFGGSITDRTERSPAFQAECMAKCLRKLGVEKCTLVGLSYGGMVGFKMAEMFPDLVDSFVVSCSVMALTESISRASLERIGFPSWVRHLVPDTVEGVKKIVDVSNYKSLWMPHFLYKDVFENLINNNGEERLWALMAFGLVVAGGSGGDCNTAYNINRKERVELLDALIVKDKDFSPTSYPQNTARRIHLLWGEEDVIFNMEVARNLQEKLLAGKAPLHYIEKAGHGVPLERPFAYNRQLKKILVSLHGK